MHDTKNPLTGAGDEEEAKEAPRVSDPAPPGPASTEDAVAVLAAAFCFIFFSYVVLAREDAPFATFSPYFFDDSKVGNPNTISGGLSLIVCTVTAFAGAYGALLICGWVRRRRSLEEDIVSPKDVELRVPATPRRAAGPERGRAPRRRAARAGRRDHGGRAGRAPRGPGRRAGRRADDVVHVKVSKSSFTSTGWGE